MASSSKKVDLMCILSSPKFGDVKKRFYALVVKAGNAPAAPGDALLPPLLRLHFVIHDAITIHEAKSVGSGAAFVPFTDADVAAWSTSGNADEIPDLIERIDDVKTTLVQMRARMPTTSAFDKLIYENSKKQMIQTANAVLVNALVHVTRGQEGVKNLEHHAAYKAHQDDFDVMPKAQILEFYKHSFQSHFRVFADMFARRMISSTVRHASLNTPPEVDSQTLGEYIKIIMKIISSY
jgi:hypothetical protein